MGAENRDMTKRYLKLFIERITITLPKIEILGRTQAILATLEKETVLGTELVPRTEASWLPGTDSCKNFRETIFIKGKQRVAEYLLKAKGEEKAGIGAFAGWGGQ
jgi:hypothetical protein